MRYYSSAFPVFASTDGVAYEIFISGCRGHCKGCHSPHTHDFDAGILIDKEFLTKLSSDIDIHYERGLIDNICILGGEPLDQNKDELIDFLLYVKDKYSDCKLWLYTSYELSEVDKDILELLDYIKCGKYLEELSRDEGFKSKYGPTLISSNQHIYKKGIDY